MFNPNPITGETFDRDEIIKGTAGLMEGVGERLIAERFKKKGLLRRIFGKIRRGCLV